jgi:hypothetical protein
LGESLTNTLAYLSSGLNHKSFTLIRGVIYHRKDLLQFAAYFMIVITKTEAKAMLLIYDMVIEQASVMTIVNYNRNMFTVQATEHE